jgi:hypothetical protein
MFYFIFYFTAPTDADRFFHCPRYGNMDYAVASAWKHFAGLMFFLLSYDIMCQWSKNLKERLLKLPPALRFHLAQFFCQICHPKTSHPRAPENLSRDFLATPHPGRRAI